MATTTLNRMAKKLASSTSTVILQANRIPRRNYTSAIFTTPLKTSNTISSTSNSTFNPLRTTLIPTHHHFSAQAKKQSNSDDSFISLIESNYEQIYKKPRDFPFKIVDYAWNEDTIILTRDYEGEKIEVKVQGPKYINAYRPYVKLEIIVSKNCGSTLEIDVRAEANKLEILHFNVKNTHAFVFTSKDRNPSLWKLDDKLNKRIYKYLEDRGFEPSIGKFLWDYMDNRKHTGWFDNLKKFIAT